MDAVVDDGSQALFQFQSPNTPPAAASSAIATTTPARSNSLGKPKTQASKRNRKPPPRILPILSAAAIAGQGFISGNGTRMLPSQLVDFQRQLDSLNLPVQIPSSIPPQMPSSFGEESIYDRLIAFGAAGAEFDSRWFQYFRMSNPTFRKLLELLAPSIASRLPPSILPDVALAAALYRLAHGAPYATVARWFGLDSPEAARLAFFVVCQTVCENMSMFVEFWKEVELTQMGFRWVSLPNCCGALGFQRFGFENKELGTSGSFLVQALVDTDGRFLDISTGWPGTMSPESILRESKFFASVQQSDELRTVPAYDPGNGVLFRPYIIGDPSLPLLPWLLTPFIAIDDEVTNLGEKEFNAQHSRGMALHSTAFARLRARWQLLRMKWRDDEVEFLPFVIVMACVLHNFLINAKEPFPEECQELGASQQREQFPVYKGVVDERARWIRDKLAHHLGRACFGRMVGKSSA
ncbi:unnamed protein product [Linum tenue]|uniref:DDE Tnp4 domain-containing protein n=1 Tax=Linum tenue TaxID=586396 RepID=A0AAV0S8H9_9ROSI|nr:unnamed protein product [Linum tenue]